MSKHLPSTTCGSGTWAGSMPSGNQKSVTGQRASLLRVTTCGLLDDHDPGHSKAAGGAVRDTEVGIDPGRLECDRKRLPLAD